MKKFRAYRPILTSLFMSPKISQLQDNEHLVFSFRLSLSPQDVKPNDKSTYGNALCLITFPSLWSAHKLKVHCNWGGRYFAWACFAITWPLSNHHRHRQKRCAIMGEPGVEKIITSTTTIATTITTTIAIGVEGTLHGRLYHNLALFPQDSSSHFSPLLGLFRVVWTKRWNWLDCSNHKWTLLNTGGLKIMGHHCRTWGSNMILARLLLI